ncbi:MAG: PilT/PilU family type 4a pilus ATPase [Elusimicrobia bacterium]|nr:PilT/PilU family type 4a pilus ATPase [Elusimicrobiota bacterium]
MAMPEMLEILNKAVAMGVSDVLIIPGEPPLIRVDGRLQKLDGMAVLPPAETKRLIYTILNQRQASIFEKAGEVDMPYSLPNQARFRVNVYLQHQGIACALRPLAATIPTPEEIGLTSPIIKLTDVPRGLVIIAGPTGSGKSTTMASLIQYMNEKQRKHIITIEDPIEFVFKDKSCVIDQREVGTHTGSFANALRSAVRENPDVIMVGEMRDLETIELAMRAAETGHLCFSTLHTRDAPSTIDRVVSEFPSVQQNKVKMQLSTTLVGVISQVLVPKKGGGRICAREIMVMNSSLGTMIREGKLHQIPGALQAAKNSGMCSLDQALADLILSNTIEVDTAWEWASDIKTLENLISSLGTIQLR